MSIQLLTYKNLNRFSSSIKHFSTTRAGGFSEGAFESLNLGLFTTDNPDYIQANRNKLCATLDISIDNLMNAHQTHGTDIKIIDNEFLQITIDKRQLNLNGHDALMTNIPGICITVTTADCVPILLFDTKNKAIAAVHSGWRGTVNNIVQKTIAKMEEIYGTQAQDLCVAIGPCIGKNVYEVGEDVFSLFEKNGCFETHLLFSKTNKEKYLFDIRQAVFLQIEKLGISDIEVSNHCTYSNDDLFFSARKAGINSGRMLSGIIIK